MSTDLLHKDTSERIIGAGFDVHSFRGNSFQEVIYQRAMAYEMSQRLYYLKVHRTTVGLLINSGSNSLTFKRYILSPDKQLRNP